MEEKRLAPEVEEKETVSRNFIQQEIDKDLAEGVYDHVQTPSAKSLSISCWIRI